MIINNYEHFGSSKSVRHLTEELAEIPQRVLHNKPLSLHYFSVIAMATFLLVQGKATED